MSSLINRDKLLLIFLGSIVILTTLFLYRDSIFYYFFQDDWFVLNNIQGLDLSNLLTIFKFRQDIIYYRPVGMFLYFYFCNKMFGLAPIYFHLCAFLFHFLNAIVVFMIANALYKNPKASAIASFLYSTSAIHFMSLSWLSLTWNITGTFFIFLTVLIFLSFDKAKTNNKSLLIILTTIIALLTSEFALTIAPILFLISKLGKKTTAETITTIIPIIIIDLIYAFLRFVVFIPPLNSDYSIGLISIFKNSFWYFAWMLNVPESLREHLTFSSLSITKDFSAAFKPFIEKFLLFFVTLILTLAIMLAKTFSKNTARTLVICLGIFFTGILPVILFSNHSFPYYLAVANLGFVLFVSYLVTSLKFNPKIDYLLLLALVVAFSMASLTNVQFEKKIQWIPGEQSISKAAISKIPTSGILYQEYILFPANNQVKQSLMDQNALQVFLNNKNVKTTFLAESPKDIISDRSKVYIKIY